MSNQLRRCPHCGAYVMGHDDRCPRCDRDLSGDAGEPVQDSAQTLPDMEDTPAAEATHIHAELPALVLVQDQATAAEDEEPEPAQADAAPDVPAHDTSQPEPQDALESVAPEDDAAHETHGADETEASRAAAEIAALEDMSAEETLVEDAEDEDTKVLDAQDAGTSESDVEPSASEAQASADLEDDASASATRPGRDEVEASAEREREPDVHTTRPGTTSLDAGEMPTRGYEMDDERGEDAIPDRYDLHATQESALPPAESAPREPDRPAYIVPPAPYTPPPSAAMPPPAAIVPPAPGYAPVHGYAQQASGMHAAVAYLQQRVNAYRRGGYRLQTHGQYEASLALGKQLGVGGWLLALLTVIGALWYLLILAMSGFQRDVVYVVLEDDGRVYEDGPGAAHIRRKRARAGQRWSVIGLLLFFVSFIMTIILSLVAGLLLTQDRYQAALREAYPAVTLFEENFSTDEAVPNDVQRAKDGAVAFAVIGVLTAVGLWGGATLFVIGTVHASAYRTQVPPLPGWA